MTNPDEHFTFRGFQSPRYTQVPDELFDELMPLLSGAELKVLLYITRKTFGWKKDSDNISISQMLNGVERRHDGAPVDHGVGLSKKTLLQALSSLEAKHIILIQRRKSPERGWEPTCYRLNILSATLGGETTPTLGEKLHQGVGAKSTPSPRGKNYPIQQTPLQETTRQETQESYLHPSDEISTSNIRNGNANIFKTTDKSMTALTASLTTPALPGETPPAPHRGFQTPTTVLRHQYSPRSNVPSEARQAIGNYMHDFALELGDQAPLRSTISRAVNLYEKTGLSLSDFISYLYSARSQTKEYSGSIRKGRGERSKGWQPASKMAYWFAVLEDQLGFREPTETPAAAHPDLAELHQKPVDNHVSTRISSSRPRRSIGGPLVRAVPLRQEADNEPGSGWSTASSERPATPQKRLKSRRSESGEHPRASRES